MSSSFSRALASSLVSSPMCWGLSSDEGRLKDTMLGCPDDEKEFLDLRGGDKGDEDAMFKK